MENQNLLDRFAEKAMVALINKLPLLDREGEVGEKLSAEQISNIKKDIAASAYEYAQWMLIARNERKQWLQENASALGD